MESALAEAEINIKKTPGSYLNHLAVPEGRNKQDGEDLEVLMEIRST